MRPISGWIAAGLLLVASGATGQTTVYKCETPHGTVYSGQPCATDGELGQVLHLEPLAAPDPVEVARRRAVREERALDLRRQRLARQEVACIDNRAAATRRGTRQRIESLHDRIARLKRSLSVAYNNLAGATRNNGIREQIAGLRAAIGNEKSILARTELHARSICAQQRQQAMAATQSQP